MIACDEVGRGALFGPVTVGAVAAPLELIREFFTGEPFHEVRDSKLVPPAKRELLYRALRPALRHRVFHCSVNFIDSCNINEAIKLGIYRVTQPLLKSLDADVDETLLLVDGNYRFEYPALMMQKPMPALQTLVKGDQKSFMIAAASIMAKVERDRLIHSADVRFPEYGLATNMGYGTPAHIRAIKSVGATRFHRKVFVSRLLPGSRPS